MGTVGSLQNLKAIVDRLDSPAVIIVSALGGLTDQLIATAKLAAEGDPSFTANVGAMAERHHDIIRGVVPESRQEEVLGKVDELLSQLSDLYTGLSLIRDLSEKTLNHIVSFGERMSSIIVAAMLDDADHVDSLSYMKTEKWFNKNICSRQVTDALIRESFRLPLRRHVVAGGFIARDKDTLEITNLGRGGSDYTAALVAAALNADSLEIWTDVDGFMTADPRIIKDARVIGRMTFIESMELCSYGAKVIYPPTIYPVFHKNIPIKILNTHNPSAPGTLITDSTEGLSPEVRGVSAVKNTAMVSVAGTLASNVAEISSRAYNAMARNGISVFLIAQPGSSADFSISVAGADVIKAADALREEFAPELQSGDVSAINVTSALSIIAVVRESVKSLKGLGARLVNTLQREGIEVKAISDGASETTIALVTEMDVSDRALALIHDACFR